jgi:hypothetical protein
VTEDDLIRPCEVSGAADLPRCDQERKPFSETGWCPVVAKQIPSHWGQDGGDPNPTCGFVPFVTWAFGPIPPGTLLGKCDSTVPTTMYVQRPSVSKGSVLEFKVCSTHRGRAVETQAEKEGDYSVVM